MADDHNHEIVMKIIRAKDHWEVLGISKSESVEHASKCFKRLSIKVHPDKCKHPKAEDAFKKLNEAKRVLTDEKLRERYLHTGSAEEQPRARSPFHGGGGSTYYNPYTGRYYYQSDDPMDDFMRAFFGAQFGGPGAQQRSHRQHFSFQQQRRSQQHQNTRSRVLSAFSMGAAARPMYSLKQTNDYPIEMQTLSGKIRYYLPRDFDTSLITTADDQMRFERPIIEAWKQLKHVECQYERLHKQKMESAASNDNQKKLASEFIRKSCEDLEAFTRGAR